MIADYLSSPHPPQPTSPSLPQWSPAISEDIVLGSRCSSQTDPPYSTALQSYERSWPHFLSPLPSDWYSVRSHKLSMPPLDQTWPLLTPSGCRSRWAPSQSNASSRSFAPCPQSYRQNQMLTLGYRLPASASSSGHDISQGLVSQWVRTVGSAWDRKYLRGEGQVDHFLVEVTGSYIIALVFVVVCDWVELVHCCLLLLFGRV